MGITQAQAGKAAEIAGKNGMNVKITKAVFDALVDAPEPTPPVCWAGHPQGDRCTLAKGHDGEHRSYYVARVGYADSFPWFSAWPQDPPARDWRTEIEQGDSQYCGDLLHKRDDQPGDVFEFIGDEKRRFILTRDMGVWRVAASDSNDLLDCSPYASIDRNLLRRISAAPEAK